MNYKIGDYEARDFCACDREVLEEILAIRNTPEVARWMYSAHITHKGHFEFVEHLKLDKTQRYWAILHNGYILGVGSLTRMRHQHAYLGIYTNPKATHITHKGQEILKIIEHIAFEELGLHSLFLEVMSTNARAIDFYTKAGFGYNGTLQDFVVSDGRFCDVLIMSKSDVANFEIARHSTNTAKAPLIVAELSANHCGSLEIARDSLRAIAQSGANAVKLQTYKPSCLTLDAKNEHFRIQGGLWEDRYLYELYEEAQTPWEWHKELFALGRELGLVVFSSPFSKEGVDFLESLGCPMYKIASFEVLDLELVEYVARLKKPMILSSGVADDRELHEAITLCKKCGVRDLTLLLCASAYPAPLDSVHLASMPTFAQKYGVKFGLSDHTLGTLCASVAVALGASVVEKHFILDKSLQSADSAFSLDVQEFGALVREIHNVCEMMGEGECMPTQKRGREFARSIWVVRDIGEGEELSAENIKVLRPNGGLHPRIYKSLLGRKAARALKFGQPLTQGDVL